MLSELGELYTDYLLCAFGPVTATQLAQLSAGQLSHDRITRYLATEDFDSKSVWRAVKPSIRAIEQADGVLVVDDSIHPKPHMAESSLVCWHYSHTEGRVIKGINTLTALYAAQDARYPVANVVIEKPKIVHNAEKQRFALKALVSKHHHYQSMLRASINNGVSFRYVLNDVWYACAENMTFVVEQGKQFVMPLKSNRRVALSARQAAQDQRQAISTLRLEEGEVVEIHLQGVDFPLLLCQQVFKNDDGSEGILYLVTSDLTLGYAQLTTLYQRRWSVECFFKSWKQHAAPGRSPAKTSRAQRNHLYLSLFAYIRLENMRVQGGDNHFALRARLYLRATQAALHELHVIRQSLQVTPGLVA